MVCQAGQGQVHPCFPVYPAELGQGDFSSLVLPSELVLELIFLPTDLFELALVMTSFLIFLVVLDQGKLSFLVVLVAWDQVVV